MSVGSPGVCPRCEDPLLAGEACAGPRCGGYHGIPERYMERLGARAPHPEMGRLVGRYLVVGCLGEGGFGEVLLALQQPIGLEVALKRLHGHRADAAVLSQLEQEARALAALRHPNIVRLLDYATVEGEPHLAMELVDGGAPLSEWIADRSSGQGIDAGALDVLQQLLAAVEAAHDAGIVHRDIKPGNVLLQPVPGRPPLVRVLDFGLARATARAPDTTGRYGTPLYMAPEQLEGRGIGPAADLYAVAAIAFEIATGKAPYAGARIEAIVARKLMADSDPAGGVAGLSPGQRAFFQRALARRPVDRFGTAAELQEALQEVFGARYSAPDPTQLPPSLNATAATEATLSGKSRAGRPRTRVAGALLALLVAGGTVFALTREDADPTPPPPPPRATPVEATCGSDPKTCAESAHAAWRGLDGPVDLERAEALYRECCAAGDLPCCNDLGFFLQRGTLGEHSAAAARPLYRRACDGGAIRACVNLAVLLQRGFGGDADQAGAARAFQKACDGGHLPACGELGRHYFRGHGVAQDHDKAYALLARACDGGSQHSCNWLGVSVAQGLGVKADSSRALELFDNACRGGVHEACTHAGIVLEQGSAGDPDPAKALTFFERACAGSAKGCFLAGRIYYLGAGAQKDEGRAVALFKKACDGGERQACEALKPTASQTP